MSAADQLRQSTPAAAAPLTGSGGAAIEAPAARGLYLLHFAPPYEHAEHYLGWSANIARRIAEHYACGSHSSPLVRAALASGSTVTLARVWRGGTRTEERRLKNGGGLSRHCPLCRARGAWHR